VGCDLGGLPLLRIFRLAGSIIISRSRHRAPHLRTLDPPNAGQVIHSRTWLWLHPPAHRGSEALPLRPRLYQVRYCHHSDRQCLCGRGARGASGGALLGFRNCTGGTSALVHGALGVGGGRPGGPKLPNRRWVDQVELGASSYLLDGEFPQSSVRLGRTQLRILGREFHWVPIANNFG